MPLVRSSPLFVVVVLLATPSWGQRVVIPSPPATGSGGMVPVQPYGTPPAMTPGVAPAPSGATLGTPAYDPYAPPSTAAPFGSSPSPTPWTTPPGVAPPATAPPPGYNPGAFGQPGAPPPANPYSTPPFGTTPPPATGPTSPWGTMPPSGAPGYPSYPGYGGLPGQPSSLFPNGFGGPGSQPPMRLIDNLRMRESWVNGGSDPFDLGINDIEFATTFQFPNFFGTTTPLLISPNFVLHLWDGPKRPPPLDLPPNAYSAFLDFAWKSNPALLAGADLSVSVGAFTDFNTFTDDSIRIQGLGLGWVRLTPHMMLKLGVNYIDRVDLKLLPAVGVLWEPNPNMKLDIFFPRPKLAFRMSQMPGTDVWLYLAAEYGGGSWTIQHSGAGTDQIDINDIRVSGGLEWVGQSGLRGQFEVAWVTSRDVVYRYTPNADFSPPDSFMLRAGISY